jgi:hypothetical protein
MTTEKYKRNPLSRAGNEEVILKMRTEHFKIDTKIHIINARMKI